MSSYNANDYWDWYDNGPGSENWKRELRQDSKALKENMEFIRSMIFDAVEKEEKKEKVIDLPEELFEI